LCNLKIHGGRRLFRRNAAPRWAPIGIERPSRDRFRSLGSGRMELGIVKASRFAQSAQWTGEETWCFGDRWEDEPLIPSLFAIALRKTRAQVDARRRAGFGGDTFGAAVAFARLRSARRDARNA